MAAEAIVAAASTIAGYCDDELRGRGSSGYASTWQLLDDDGGDDDDEGRD